MMKITLIAVLAVLVLAALSGQAEGQTRHTYVSNGSSRTTIVASTSYQTGTGTSHYHNRVIAPGEYQGDQYYGTEMVTVEIWVLDGCCHSFIRILEDLSLVVLDSTDPQVQQDGGVDVFQVIHGYLFRPEGPRLATIYPGTGLCDYTTWSCCSISGNPCSFG